jgi:hypothetical protein
MSATSEYVSRTERIAKSVDINIEDTLVLVSQWLYVRTEYAKQYIQINGHEPNQMECYKASLSDYFIN